MVLCSNNASCCYSGMVRTPKTRAIGYLRVSTAEQTTGFGLEVQEKAIRDYCRIHGVRLVHVESDEGRSGSNGLEHRIGLARALAALEGGDADALVVYRLDRLARDMGLQETTIARLRKAGCEVRSVTEADIDTDDPTRVLVRQLLGCIAQYEGAVIRGRMASGRAAKAERGGYVAGSPPYGWRAEGGKLVEDGTERAHILSMERLRADGASYREIVAWLEANGVMTKRGARWTASAVQRVLDPQARERARLQTERARAREVG